MKRDRQLNVRITARRAEQLQQIADLFHASQADVLSTMIEKLHFDLRVAANQTDFPTYDDRMKWPLLYEALRDYASRINWQD